MNAKQKVDFLRKEKQYNCAQVVYTLTMENAGHTPPEEMVDALRGFGGGMACGKICGCLTGGSAALCSLVPQPGPAGKRTSREETAALIAWFEDTFKSTECSVLKHPQDGSSAVPCPLLMEETFRHCAAKKQADLDGQGE